MTGSLVHLFGRILFLAALVACASIVEADGPATRPAMFKGSITPRWTDETHFWYRNELPDGRSEVVVIDAVAGTRQVVDSPPGPNIKPATSPSNTRDGQSRSRPATTASSGPISDEPRNRRRAEHERSRSPDGRHVAFIRDHNIFVGTTDEDAKAVTTDGTSALRYDRLFWSPDGSAVVMYRKQQGDHLNVYRLESSPRGSSGQSDGSAGRAVLQSNEYTLPGDKLDTFDLSVFNLNDAKVIKADVDPIDANAYGSHPRSTAELAAGRQALHVRKI